MNCSKELVQALELGDIEIIKILLIDNSESILIDVMKGNYLLTMHSLLLADFNFFLPIFREYIIDGGIDMLSWDLVCSDPEKTFELFERLLQLDIRPHSNNYIRLTQALFMDWGRMLESQGNEEYLSSEGAFYCHLLLRDPKTRRLLRKFINGRKSLDEVLQGWTYQSNEIGTFLDRSRNSHRGEMLKLCRIFCKFRGTIKEAMEDPSMGELRGHIPLNLLE